jgi:hypothetical protein
MVQATKQLLTIDEVANEPGCSDKPCAVSEMNRNDSDSGAAGHITKP